MELVITLISLATAIIGLVGTFAGRKQVIIIRQGLENERASGEENTTTTGERSPPSATQPAQSREPVPLQHDHLHWYDKTGWLVLSFILCWPLGLYGIAKSRAVKRSWKMATFGVVIPVSIVISFVAISGALQSSWAYQNAMELARNNSAVIKELGEPIESTSFVSGSIKVSGPSGKAELSIPLEGPRNTATLYVVATKQVGEWKFEKAEVEIEGRKSRIYLLRERR